MTSPSLAVSDPQGPVAPPRKPRASGGSNLGRYIVTRLLLIIPTVFILVTMVFMLMRLIGDPITAARAAPASPSAMRCRWKSGW